MKKLLLLQIRGPVENPSRIGWVSVNTVSERLFHFKTAYCMNSIRNAGAWLKQTAERLLSFDNFSLRLGVIMFWVAAVLKISLICMEISAREIIYYSNGKNKA